MSNLSSLTSLSADLLVAVTGGAAPATLPNGEPNGQLTGGPAPVTFQPKPIFQDEAMAKFNAQESLKEWVKNANILTDVIKSGWPNLR